MARFLTILLTATLMLSACADSSQQGADHSSDSSNQVQASQSPVLATVDGDAITQADFDSLLERNFPQLREKRLDQSLKTELLDSLIASKAMKKAVQKQADKSTLTRVQAQVKAYEEELFVREYLLKNAVPQPVSSQMVESYYEQNPEEFGGGDLKTVQLLKTRNKPSEDQRNLILAQAESIKSSGNWQDFDQKSKTGLSFFTSKVQSKDQLGLFEPAIQKIIDQLAENQTSDVIFLDGIPHIVRVVKVEPLPTKPFATVSQNIRQKLAALQLKAAVEKATQSVLKTVEVDIK